MNDVTGDESQPVQDGPVQRVWSKRADQSRKISTLLLGACVATMAMASTVRPALTYHSLLDEREQENSALSTQLLAEQRHRHTSVAHLINKSAEFDVGTLSSTNYCEISRQIASDLTDLRGAWERGLEVKDLIKPSTIGNAVTAVKSEPGAPKLAFHHPQPKPLPLRRHTLASMVTA